MENFNTRMRQLKIPGKLPGKREIDLVFAAFSKRERIVFLGFFLVLLFSTIAMLGSINRSFMLKVPLHEGSISLGIVGTPRFINPILASGDADLDLTALIYSGLMRKDSSGNIIPDLAEKVEKSPDGLVYTFTLKDNLFFQDGRPLTADDVLFTINKVTDSIIKSPRKAEWSGVNAEKIDEKTVRFTLKQPYASFLENATIGIMPAHVWANSPLELNDANTNPVGSGPYMIGTVGKQASGIINSYELVPFNKFILGIPYIQKIDLHFYANENNMTSALGSGEIDQTSSVTPLNAQILKEENFQVSSSLLPRIFGLFFNQNQNQLFIDKAIISAIDQTINKDRIIQEVLFGYGEVIDSPIPPNMLNVPQISPDAKTPRAEVLKKVQDSLAKDGWKVGSDGILEKTQTVNKKSTTTQLEFSISTGDIPELTKAAELIKQDLEEIGMKVDVKTFEIGNLNQSVIRPRKYDALLFGEIINHESDLFAFWHSSQRKDPGLNVAMYTNVKVDKILEDASAEVDDDKREQEYLQFVDIIKKDMPAVFLYSPDLIYVVPKNLMNFGMENIISPSEKYLNAYSWYSETENIWKIFI
jgi:peptide/nickel transport system substrate-binding protein